jgi:hypothetical protein
MPGLLAKELATMTLLRVPISVHCPPRAAP